LCVNIPFAFSDNFSQVNFKGAALVNSQQQEAANQLRQADAPANLGPADACFEQVRAIMCPIAGQIPFFRDMLGQMAVWGEFSCPTGPITSNVSPSNNLPQ